MKDSLCFVNIFFSIAILKNLSETTFRRMFLAVHAPSPLVYYLFTNVGERFSINARIPSF